MKLEERHTDMSINNNKANINNKATDGVDKTLENNFYKYYLKEHQNPRCRQLHFLGSSLGLIGMANTLKTGRLTPLFKGVTAGYACAWIGHFFFEKNKPATFKHPLKSFISDFRMYADIVKGNLSLKDKKYDKIN